nr:transposase [Paenibacillus sabinae]
MDAPRTDRCSNRCCVQIFFILLGGENPDTKATAAAFPQSFRPLRCFKREPFLKNASEEGYALAVRRMTEPESVFGQLKNNRGFQRFLLRGVEKVTLEVGWLSLAHNSLKQATVDQKRKIAILQ